MTGEMSMNKVIHAAVRRDLARLESALGAARDGDRERAAQLYRAYANLHRELTHHHETEDAWVFPALAELGVDADLLGDMESEHQAMADALADADAKLAGYAASGSAEYASAARESVVHTQGVVDRHLTHEEADLEPLMLQHADTEEWKAAEKKLRSQPLSTAGPFMAWIQDGMSEDCRGYLRSTIPAPVLFLLSRVAGRSYHRDVAPVWLT